MSLESSGEAGLWPSQPLWSPTHLELALLGCRGLRTKGGSPSFWAEAQLGRQRLRLGPPASSSSAPKWQALELPPETPDEPQTPPPLLRLSLWQKSLVGPERFLGALELPLGPQLLRLRQGAPRGQETRWYKLHSKPGKKEKERGEVQLSLQFTRQSLTASMFDLSAKEKPRSPFGRLKDKMKGRQKYDLESASAIVPGSCAALEDDLGLAEVKKGLRLGKGGFFFKGKLRKSSLTQSNTSLGSDSTLSSASSLGGIAGLETLTPSPSRHSSLSTDRSVRDFLPSPKLTHKRAFSDEVSQVNLLPESKSIQSLKPSGKEPISRSSLCINGSHIYCEEPSPKPSSSSPAPAPAPAPLPPLPSQSLPDKPEEGPAVGPPAPEPELPPWSSSRSQKGPPKDPPRFIPSPPILAAQEEDKLSVKTIALNKHRGRAKKEEALRAESRPVQIAAPLVFSSEVVRVRPHERIPKEEEDQEEGGEQETKKKKARSGFFRRRSSSKDSGTSHATAAVVETTVPSDPSNLPPRGGGEERGRSGSASSWFGRHDSKERKPSSHPGLLAPAREFLRKSPPFPEDHRPPSFGEPPPESPPQRTSIPEPPAIAAAAITPPSEWDESFDAFATSRLKPDACMENPPEVVQADALDRTGPLETGTRSLLPRGNESQGSEGAEPYPGGPDLLNFVSEERRPLGSRSVMESAEDGSRDSTLPWGPPSEEGSDPQNLARLSAESWGREEERRGELEGEPASPGGEEWWKNAWGMSVGTPVSDLDESQHHIPAASGLSSLSSAIVFSGEGDRLPVNLTDDEPTGAPSLAGGSSQGPNVEMWETPVADVCHGDLEREEEIPVPMTDAVSEVAQLPEEDNLNSGLDMEEEEEEKVAVGIEQDGGVCERRRAETPPPKPPRRFPPLSLQEEANDAAWDRQSWQDESALCGEASFLETEQQRPQTGEARPIGGSGSSSIPCAMESLQLASEPAGANDSRGPEVSSKDAMLAACKPPRRFLPLSLQEEANGSAWDRQSWQDEAAPCSKASFLETEQQRSQTGEARPTGEVIIGPGGGGGSSIPRATEHLQLASAPAGANDSRSREVSSEDVTLAACEGPGGADQFETCSSVLSVGGLTLSGAKEDACCLGEGDGGQPDSSVGLTEASKPPGVPELDSLEVIMETPGPREVGGQTCRTLSPSMLFWSALEEQRGLSSQDRCPLAPPEGRGHLDGEEEIEEPLALGLSKVDLDHSHVSQASPAIVPAKQRPSKGQEGDLASEPEPSSHCSENQVMDFKRADFWQVDGGGQQGHDSAAMTPSNPFASQLSPRPPPLPSPQNNPFVERPPDVVPAQAAILQVSPLDAPRDLLFPAPEERTALTPAPAPILHGHHPLAFSTPSLQAVLPLGEFSLPSPVGGPAAAQAPLALSQDSTQPSAPSVLPVETWRKEEEAPLRPDTSPHVVKPISSTSGPEMVKGDEGEKPKPSSTVVSLEDGVPLPSQLGKTEAKRDPLDRAAQYYHLTHEELVQLLQKREAELRKEKEHVRELENYIDRLLVRIMEQSPTLLQISLGREAKAAK